MKKFKLGLVGKTLKHSLSPTIHEFFAKSTNLSVSYELFEFEQKTDLLAWLATCGLDGFNVTIPYKETLLPELDELSETAKNCGSVNTVLLKNGKTFGENTDVFGVAKTFENIKIPKQVLLFGAGGSAKAVIFALENKVEKVFVFNRTLENALKLREQFGKIIELVLERDLENCVKNCDLIVNSTPLGMFPNIEKTPFIFRTSLAGKTVFDLVYNPQKTLFLESAECSGAKILNGLPMLIFQASKSFEIWTGKKVAETKNLQVLPEGFK
ncbi:shikimate dehydrogenase [bacterium]|nr:shikimate dehydrogenase [bacterium]